MTDEAKTAAPATALLAQALENMAQGYNPGKPVSATERFAAAVALCELKQEPLPQNVHAVLESLTKGHD